MLFRVVSWIVLRLPTPALLTKLAASAIAFRMNAPPPREAFTAKEWKLIQRLRTPRQVQRWLTEMPYNWERQGGTMRSFREVVKRNEAHCLEAAVAAAVILEQHGYPPLLLDIESWDLLDHVIFVFQRRWIVGIDWPLARHGAAWTQAGVSKFATVSLELF